MVFSFAATSDSGMTSELLDDYEEGTWTPTVESAGSLGSTIYLRTTQYNWKTGNYKCRYSCIN